MKTKSKSLKTLQNELLEYVETNIKDENVKSYVFQIREKQKYLAQKQAERKEKIGDKVKKIAVKISIGTLIFCKKLIKKEKVSAEIMGYEESSDLVVAEYEIESLIEENEE